MKSIVAAAALAAALSAAGAIEVADSVAPGSPLVGTLDGESERSLLLAPVELRSLERGHVVATSRLFRIRGLRYGFILGVPRDLPPGPYLVRSAGEQAPVQVVPRSFRREKIVLDELLSELLTRFDPAKDAENAELQRLLSGFDVEALWHRGRFVPPVGETRTTALYGDEREYLLADGRVIVGVHQGVDLAHAAGTPVLAAASGRVAMARARIMTGNTVVIEHLPGVYSLYFHLGELGVSAGDLVKAGERIGAVGATGLATGPHLHWEVRVSGVAVDPQALLAAAAGGSGTEGAEGRQVDTAGLGAIMAGTAASEEGR